MKGKLNPEQLKRCIFDIIKKRRTEVITGAAVAEDCAVIKPQGLLLLSSDPITAAGKGAGKLAIEVSVNDIAACGGEPVAAVLTIIAPVTCGENDIAAIMEEAEAAAALRNVEICGGHTEFSDAVNRTVICCTVAGFTDRAVLSSSPRQGDSIIMTKYAGIEGTAIIAGDLEGRLKVLGFTQAEIDGAKSLINEISVLKEALAVKNSASSMHDVTEGGIFGAVKEMCVSCGLGAEIHADKIPLKDITAKICSRLGINPYKLISSGSLLITTDKPQETLKALKNEGIFAAVIGNITDKGVYAYVNGKKIALSVEADEITKLSELMR